MLTHDFHIPTGEPLYQQSATGATSGKTCNQHLVCCRFQKVFIHLILVFHPGHYLASRALTLNDQLDRREKRM